MRKKIIALGLTGLILSAVVAPVKAAKNVPGWCKGARDLVRDKNDPGGAGYAMLEALAEEIGPEHVRTCLRKAQVKLPEWAQRALKDAEKNLRAQKEARERECEEEWRMYLSDPSFFVPPDCPVPDWVLSRGGAPQEVKRKD